MVGRDLGWSLIRFSSASSVSSTALFPFVCLISLRTTQFMLSCFVLFIRLKYELKNSLKEEANRELLFKKAIFLDNCFIDGVDPCRATAIMMKTVS